jgi:ketol-acid reductoisomerase
MATLFYDDDADVSALNNSTIAMIGYGSQGRAQALNLHDSGLKVLVGLRPSSKSTPGAKQDGLEVVSVADATARADIIFFQIPDEDQVDVYNAEILPNLSAGNSLVFSHGFNIYYHAITAPADINVFMLAPKSPGAYVRRMYLEGKGVPCLMAVHQDCDGQSRDLALGLAKAMGFTRAGVIESTFEEETVTDLFGEQAVLCGGLKELIKAGIDIMVEEGYQPEVAYFECINELRLVIDIIYQKGLKGLRNEASNTAEYGALTRGPRIITDETRTELRKIMKEVQLGYFAREWILENKAGCPVYKLLQARDDHHMIEAVGAEVRSMMPWISGESES